MSINVDVLYYADEVSTSAVDYIRTHNNNNFITEFRRSDRLLQSTVNCTNSAIGATDGIAGNATRFFGYYGLCPLSYSEAKVRPAR